MNNNHTIDHNKIASLLELFKDVSDAELQQVVNLRKLTTPKPTPKKPVPTPRHKSVKQLVKEYEDQPRTYKWRPPVPTPQNSVKQRVKEYEQNIIPPPPEFRDKPVPKKPVPTPRHKSAKRLVKDNIKPIPAPKTRITELHQALKGYIKSYALNIKYQKDPLLQLQSTRIALQHHIKNTLKQMNGIKFNETLVVTFKKPMKKPEPTPKKYIIKRKKPETTPKKYIIKRKKPIPTSEEIMIYKTGYFTCQAQRITNNTEISTTLIISQQQILNNIAKFVT